MSEFQTKFLYVLLKERVTDEPSYKTDTELRIVYWSEDIEADYEEGFIIYGTRPRTKPEGEFTPYRLYCRTKSQVLQFARTVVSPTNNVSIELHQFEGISNDSKDEYEVEWYNTAENKSTELVAYDVDSNRTDGGIPVLDFSNALNRTLTVLMNMEVV
jgi:hypothetical protein